MFRDEAETLTCVGISKTEGKNIEIRREKCYGISMTPKSFFTGSRLFPARTRYHSWQTLQFWVSSWISKSFDHSPILPCYSNLPIRWRVHRKLFVIGKIYCIQLYEEPPETFLFPFTQQRSQPATESLLCYNVNTFLLQKPFFRFPPENCWKRLVGDVRRCHCMCQRVFGKPVCRDTQQIHAVGDTCNIISYQISSRDTSCFKQLNYSFIIVNPEEINQQKITVVGVLQVIGGTGKCSERWEVRVNGWDWSGERDLDDNKGQSVKAWLGW